MNRSDLITALATRFPNLMMKDAEVSVQVILDAITRSLARGDHAEIRGFGSFGLKHHAAHVGRNPRTGETVKVAQKYMPHFKAGKELRERVDRSVKPEKTVPLA